MAAAAPSASTELTSTAEQMIDADLFETTFVVLDLETTGIRGGSDHIIEIGAVKVRGGEVLDTFSQLIDPGIDIPTRISDITGITTADVEGAPQLGSVLPQFLEFARGAVWVAHNAPFDISFLQAGTAELGLEWPQPAIVDTLKLARKVLRRDQVGSFRLKTLARYVGASTSPTHRALDDARATVDVLHYLLEKLAGFHVESEAELVAFSPAFASEIRAKRDLIKDAPHSPGVYIFRTENDSPLYIGTAVDLRRRLLQYFNGSDSRRRIAEMVRLAHKVDTIATPHGFAAEVREARLIASLRPPYNRQRREPTRGWYIVASPPGKPARVSRSSTSTDSIGPFRTRDTAAEVKSRYIDTAADPTIAIRRLASGGAAEIKEMMAEVTELGLKGRYKRAAIQRDRTAEFIFALDKQQRLATLAAIEHIHAAFPDGRGGWHLAEIKHGRLVSAATAPRGSDHTYIMSLMSQQAETVILDSSLYTGASLDELGIVWKWLHRPEVRIRPNTGALASPINGAGPFVEWARSARDARRTGRYRT